MLLAPFISHLRKRFWVWMLVVLGAVLGVLPDIVWLYGLIVGRETGGLYGSAHYGAIRDVLQYVPMYALHLGIDSLTHDPDRQWYGWNVRIWLQVILWGVNIVVIVWFARIWRRNLRADGSELKALKPDWSAHS
jgi:hypothetical protein